MEMALPVESKVRRMVIPKSGFAVSSSAERGGRSSPRSLLASLIFHGALIGVCTSISFSVPARIEGYEVTVLSVDAPPELPVPEMLAQQKLEPVKVEQPVEERAAERAASDVHHSASLTTLPDIQLSLAADAPSPAVIPVVEVVSADGSPVEQGSPVERVNQIEPVRVANGDGGIGYWMGVRSQILRHLVYPTVKTGRHAGTNILLRITIDGGGKLLEAATPHAESSAFALAAQRAVEQASPFAAPASDVPLTVELPVRFEKF